jgi:hypothetical protein
LKDWVAQTLPRTSTTVGEWIEKSYGVSYTQYGSLKYSDDFVDVDRRQRFVCS